MATSDGVAWSVKRGGIGGPDAVWLSIGNQGFRVKCEPDPDYPGRPEWYAEQLTKAMRSLEQAAHRAGKVAGMLEAAEVVRDLIDRVIAAKEEA